MAYIISIIAQTAHVDLLSIPCKGWFTIDALMFTICMRCDPIRRCAPTSKDAAVGAQWRRAERNNRISSISMRSTGNVVRQTGNVIYSSPITAHV